MRMLLPIHYYRKRRRNLLGQAYNILCLWSFSLQKSLGSKVSRHKQHVSWSPWVPVCVSFSVLKDGARFWKHTPQFVLYLMLKCPPVVCKQREEKGDVSYQKGVHLVCVFHLCQLPDTHSTWWLYTSIWWSIRMIKFHWYRGRNNLPNSMVEAE